MANISFSQLPQQVGLSGNELVPVSVPDGSGGYISKTTTTGEIESFILPDSGVQPGTYGDATHVGQVTIDEQGIVTAATNVEIEAGAGSVTSVSVETANGLAGTVANPTTDAAITLSTTVTGLLKGNGTAISAATPDTDYQSPISLTTTGTSGAATFSGDVLNIPVYPSGSVTSLSVVSANGFAGSVANPTTTPAITLSTSVTGLLEGDGTAISAATTTGSGSVVLATSPTLTTPTIGAASGTSLNLSGLTASSAVATDASKNLVSVTNTGSGSNVLATSPTLVTPALGTPASGILTNATGLPLTSGVTGVLPIVNGGTGTDGAVRLIITPGTYTVADTDAVIVTNLGSAGNITLDLGAVAARSLLPLVVSDFGGTATITINPNGSETIMTYANWGVSPSNSVRFVPSTALSGWFTA